MLTWRRLLGSKAFAKQMARFGERSGGDRFLHGDRVTEQKYA